MMLSIKNKTNIILRYMIEIIKNTVFLIMALLNLKNYLTIINFNKVPNIFLFFVISMIAIHIAKIGFNEYTMFFIEDYMQFTPRRYSMPDAWKSNLISTFIVPFTYSLVHSNFSHITINLLLFTPLALITKLYVNNIKFLLIFIITAGVGALFCFYGESVPLVLIGASGAVSGYFGFLCSGSYIKRIKTKPFHNVYSNTVVCVTWGIFDVILPYVMGGSTSWETHLGGFFAGIILASIFLKKLN